MSPERYYFPETMGRFVRITVNGNTQNNWASINEVSVRGYSVSAQPPSPSVPCQHLDISKITAGHLDSGTPSNNVIDGNLGTRWSNNGLGSWIQADLGQQKVICSVDISWYRGSTRTLNFVISISPDGTTFTDAFAGKSSGNTLSKERYDIPSVTGRFVRITVNGNTQNNWAAITEIGVNGFDIPIGTGGNGTGGGGVGGNGTGGGGVGGNGTGGGGVGGNGTGGGGVGGNGTGGGGVGGNGTGGGGVGGNGTGGIGFDKFGVKEIYPTKTSGEEWFMNMLSPTSDPRFEPQLSLNANPDGSYKVTSTKVRLDVFTSSGYHPETISTYDQKQLSTKGYMQSPNDWKNVEMTGYIKLNKFGDSNEHFTWYTRGGKHQDANNGCEGSAIKGDLYNDGRTRFAKEQWHSGGYVFTPLKKLTDSIAGKWVGFKTMIYSINQSNGNIAVKMENWVDQNNTGIWKKIDEFVDNGGFGSEGKHCGGAPNQIISWGGPVATFRWDSASDVDVKNLSVREIQAP